MSTFEDAIEDQIQRAYAIEELEREQEADRKAYNCAVANGKTWDAQMINWRMSSRAKAVRRLT